MLEFADENDVRIRDSLIAGSERALAEVYDAYGPVVYGVALHLTRDQGAAEDIAQDVFVDLWRRPERFDPQRAPLRGWLCMIARRRGIDWARRRRTQQNISLTDMDVASTGFEDDVLASPDRQDLQRIFELKHHLVSMRKVLSPQRDVFGLLAKRGDARVKENTALYLRDVYDHLVRINESIEANRDLLGNALEAYLSAMSQRTNEVMKYLTIMSAVFLPLAFVVGFFGQNFYDLPFFPDWMHSDKLMWGMLVTCFSLPVGMIAWFKHKRWL